MTQKTILNDTHRALGAKMVDFGGWDMPLNYGSQIEEHHAVRRDAGMFDVSHMTRRRPARRARARVPAPAARQQRRQAEGAGQGALLVHAQRARRRDRRPDRLFPAPRTSSASSSTRRRATRTSPGSRQQAQAFGVKVTERADFAMIAVQGPNAREKVLGLLRRTTRAKAGEARQVRRRRGDGRTACSCSSRAPATPARTASRSSCRKRSAVALWNALLRRRRRSRRASARATRCAWKPA